MLDRQEMFPSDLVSIAWIEVLKLHDLNDSVGPAHREHSMLARVQRTIVVVTAVEEGLVVGR